MLTIAMILPTVALASSAITQGFLSKTPLQAGTIVSLNKNPGIIAPTTSENLDSVVGVVASGDSAVFSTSENAEEVPVATSGVINVFVSTANGDIKVGDRITVKELAGVGVKASNSTRILGVAQGSFDAKTAGAQKQSLTDTKGNKHEVYIGQIPVLIGIAYYTAVAGEQGKSSFLPTALQDIANVIAGKVVSPFAVLISLIVVILAFSIAGIMLNGAVQGGMVSIGRNPLAKLDVYKGLFGVIGVALATIFAGILLGTTILKYL